MGERDNDDDNGKACMAKIVITRSAEEDRSGVTPAPLPADNGNILPWNGGNTQRIIHPANLQNVFSGMNTREVVRSVRTSNGLAHNSKRSICEHSKERDAHSRKWTANLGGWIDAIHTTSQVRGGRDDRRQNDHC